MKHFEGKIALVTGSSRGLGKAIAFKLASAGATLILHASKETPRAIRTFQEIRTISPKSKAYYADFLKRTEIVEMADRIRKDFPRLDILINNAGIEKSGAFLNATDEEWDTVMKVNLYGTYHMTKLFLPSLIKRGKGRIINISSIYGLVGEYGLTSYCASKAAIIGFTKALSKEVAKYAITVNAVCPGFTDEGMANRIPEKILALRIKSIPLGRVGKKEEIAKLVAFLSSEDAGYITGQAISINGGLL